MRPHRVRWRDWSLASDASIASCAVALGVRQRAAQRRRVDAAKIGEIVDRRRPCATSCRSDRPRPVRRPGRPPAHRGDPLSKAPATGGRPIRTTTSGTCASANSGGAAGVDGDPTVVRWPLQPRSDRRAPAIPGVGEGGDALADTAAAAGDDHAPLSIDGTADVDAGSSSSSNAVPSPAAIGARTSVGRVPWRPR